MYNKLVEDFTMRAITYTTARNNLASTMQKVCDDQDPILITRKNNSAVVLMSVEEYDALKETAYLMQSPKNAKRLMEAIETLENGNGTERELIE